MLKKILLCLSLCVATGVQAGDEHDYILATASTGGVFYPVGVALSTLTKVKLQPEHGISVSAISSAGSDENIRLMGKGEAQLSILQGLYGYYAWNGLGPMEEAGKQENLRSITMLWQNYEHFLLDKQFIKTGTVEDFKSLLGKRMVMGPRNSGTLGSNKLLFAGVGIDIDKDFELVYGGYQASTDALQNGQAVGGSLPTGIPASSITKLFAATPDYQLLNVTDEQMMQMDGGKALWTRETIPANTYPGQDYEVKTIAQPLFLATTDGLPEEDVYLITKTIYENLPFLQGIHSATKAMSIEKAIAGLPVPLHSGAVKFYREQGIEIPDRLVAK